MVKNNDGLTTRVAMASRSVGQAYFDIDSDDEQGTYDRYSQQQTPPAKTTLRRNRQQHQHNPHNDQRQYSATETTMTAARTTPSRSFHRHHLDQNGVVTWRGDPEITGADFTIIIAVVGDSGDGEQQVDKKRPKQKPATIANANQQQQQHKYFVHRHVLCHDGPRCCQYFANYLSSREQVSSSSKKRRTAVRKSMVVIAEPSSSAFCSVKVELDRAEADNFPVILDFMYSGFVPETKKDHFRAPSPRTIGSFRKTHPGLKTVPTFETVSTMSNGTSFSSHPPCTLTGRSLHVGDDETPANHRDALGDAVQTGNAVSLRYLAIQLENVALRQAVNIFIQNDLSLQTGPRYMIMANEYNDIRLLQSAQQLCIENFPRIDTKSLARLPLPLFRSIIESFQSQPSARIFDREEDGQDHVVDEECSKKISEVVCRYLEKHPRSRCAELLLDLTDPGIMPHMAPDAAIGFTAIIKDLDETDVSLHWRSLVRFSQRCAKAVVHEYGWGDFSVTAAVDEFLGKSSIVNDRSNNQGSALFDHSSRMAAIDCLLFATSFAAALEQAQDDYEEINLAHEDLDSMVSLLHTSATQWESVCHKQDQYIKRQRMALHEAHRANALLRQELDTIRLREQQQQQYQFQQQQSQQQDSHQQHTTISYPENGSQLLSTIHQSTMEQRLPLATISESSSSMDIEQINLPAVKELISPAQVESRLRSARQRTRRRSLRTKSEMRATSLLL